MGRLINSTYLSLDGVVQHPERWTFDYRSDDAAAYSHDLLFGADTLLMGRRTYDIFAAHWPDATDDEGFADRMNAVPHYVVSTTLTSPSWHNTIVVPPDKAVEVVREVKTARNLLQYGFGQVTAVMLEAGLVDELQVWLHPLLVGRAAPNDLLAATAPAARFRLEDVQRFSSGLLVLRYGPR
ncbi:dihydrofolate reductase family protein [Kribbella sp. NPDC026611]|uniref:dihydrofolate reductase family protein n=1 Tax=Kribbella sp. NPDC026611 TaxID=3154911 RepID=UPI0033E0C1CD